MPSSPYAAARPVARQQLGWLHRFVHNLFAPVHITFLAAFRVFFAAMMLWTVWDFFADDLIATLYLEPQFHFTYHGFAWVRPWPGNGLYVHLAALGIAALGVLLGVLYRLSALLMFLGFSYVFLLDKAEYFNHYYLMCLVCLLLIFLPAHRAWSLDAWLRPRLRSEAVPAWTLWLLRFQIGLPYVAGGIAKLQPDWLQGQPMQLWLSKSVWYVLLGPVAQQHWLALLFSWGGLIFDLSVVPLLLWKPTRPFAFAAAVGFHLMNAFMFNIGIFPWMMIGATTVFFAPDWPRKLITPPPDTSAGARTLPAPAARPEPCAASVPQNLVVALWSLYVLVQMIVPCHGWLYPGNVLWTEEGYLFSWHMMLRDKKKLLSFMVTDRGTGQNLNVDFRRWKLTPKQIDSMGDDPEMQREFAHFLREQYQAMGKDVEVRVLILCSLNGRKPQPLVNPTVDLSRQPRSWFHQEYIVPLREPLRRRPWSVPESEWQKHLVGPQR